MNKKFRNPAFAAGAASYIYQKTISGLEAVEVDRLIKNFRLEVEESGLSQTLLSNRVLYAERLATSPGPLLYEEMHKLFNLCEEILALRSFGYELEPEIYNSYVESVHLRLQKEHSVARLVVEDQEIEDKDSCWWGKLQP